MENFLGIDIGGSGFKYGWGNCKEGLHFFQTIYLKKKDIDEFLATAKQIFQTVDNQVGLHTIKGIGIGIPGTLDKLTGCVVGNNPNLPFWVNHSPRELIPTDCKLPFAFDNDANLMALAEASLQRKQNIIGVTIGSGIGCGIIIEGRIFQGANGYAGELGHICAVDKGIKCSCGKLGCLEAYSSVDGLRRCLALAHPRYAEMDLPALMAVKDTDTLVNEYIKRSQHLLSIALANLATCLDPETIIMGGGAMDFDLYCIKEMEKEIRATIPLAHSAKMTVNKASEGNKAGVIGAIKLIEQKFYGGWE
ncbi:MAG: ROK family protein [Candidatus Cloacimonas sp.]